MHSWNLLEMNYFARGLPQILWKSIFFVFEPNLKKVPGATFKISKCVQKFFLAFLAVRHLTIFIPSFKDIFEFFQKLKLVISDEFRSFGHTFTRKASGLREVVIRTVASY